MADLERITQESEARPTEDLQNEKALLENYMDHRDEFLYLLFYF